MNASTAVKNNNERWNGKEVSNELTIFGDEQELLRFKKHVENQRREDARFRKVVPINSNERLAVWSSSLGSRWMLLPSLGESEDGTWDITLRRLDTSQKVVRAMANQFPGLRFDYRYSEPGLDFSGQMLFENGALLSESEFEWGFIPFLQKWGNSNYPVEK